MLGREAEQIQDPDELLVLAEKVPEPIRRRVLERPDAFKTFAELDDSTLDKLLAQVKPKSRPGRHTPA